MSTTYDQSVQAFIGHVDLLARIYELDPELPELVRLKLDAHRIVGGKADSDLHLRLINPEKYVSRSNGTIIVHDPVIGSVLEPWTIARYHAHQLDMYLTKIVADKEGTHLFDGPHVAVTLKAGAIDPFMRDTATERYALACDIIRQFTGLILDPQQLKEHHQVVTVVKTAGRWNYQGSPQHHDGRTP